MRGWYRALAGAVLLALVAFTSEGSRAADCDRACLYGFLDDYMAALEAGEPERLPLAEDVRFSENNVEMAFPDGAWNTFGRKGEYDLRFADVSAGQAGLFAVVFERENPAILALRIKVADGRIMEIESLLSRFEEGRPFPKPFPLDLRPKPILEAMVPEDERTPRERMRELANGYFETLELNDGTIHTVFDPECNRVENGVQTTNNMERARENRFFGMGCEEQFRLGLYRYDDRIRARRFPLIDEERGLVFASGFIDHSGTILEFELTDGTTRATNYRTPHSYHFMEVFKIVEGRIVQVEAVFNSVPYNMPSPW